MMMKCEWLNLVENDVEGVDESAGSLLDTSLGTEETKRHNLRKAWRIELRKSDTTFMCERFPTLTPLRNVGTAITLALSSQHCAS